MNTTHRPLIIISGPTASGKSRLAVSLAKKIGGEIISADCMQVYRGMNIGSAKITQEEMEEIPHYLIDILDPNESFDVALFQELAKKSMDEIYSHGHIPIIAGGTGFYIQALLYDIDFTKGGGNSNFRKELERRAEQNPDELYQELMQVDPESCESIHCNNTKRVIRALEYFYETGEKISTHNAIEREKNSPYNAAYFVLTDNREILYKKIEERVDQMFSMGLVEEVNALKDKGYARNLVAMQGLGYKEVLDFLDGINTLDEAKYIIKRDTRHFAKRQMTWFRREKDVFFLDKQILNTEDALLTEIFRVLKEKGIQ